MKLILFFLFITSSYAMAREANGLAIGDSKSHKFREKLRKFLRSKN